MREGVLRGERTLWPQAALGSKLQEETLHGRGMGFPRDGARATIYSATLLSRELVMTQPCFDASRVCCWDVQFSHSVMSDSLRPHGLQHARPPCPSPSPRPCSNSHPLSQWCHFNPLIPSPLAFNLAQQDGKRPISIFPMYQSFASGGQSTGVSASASVLPMNIQDWFPLGWTGLISLQSKMTLKSLKSSPTPEFNGINSLVLNFLYSPTLTSVHDYWKNHSFDYRDFVSKVMSLLFNMLSRLVVTFLARSRHLLISCLQSPSAVILEPKKIKSVTVPTVSPSICHDVMGLNAMILVFWMLSFKPAFSLSSFTFIKRLFSSSLLLGCSGRDLAVGLPDGTHRGQCLSGCSQSFPFSPKVHYIIPLSLSAFSLHSCTAKFKSPVS